MAVPPLPKLDEFIETIRPEFEEALGRLVALPTVSADPAHRTDIAAAADMAASMLAGTGFKVEVVATEGNPVVLASLTADPSYQTVTIYNHLDVQPAEASEWRTDPFALKIIGDRYFGRGATDDKGPALTALMAVRYAREHHFRLNFKVVWELEEETGSVHFAEFVATHRAQLATDSVLVSDSIWAAPGRPTIDYGLRGMITFEVSLRTATQDVHSGLAGGVARNPLGELSQIIAECYDATTGRVLIPGFYEGVKAPTNAELSDFLASGFNLKAFAKAHGLTALRTTDDRVAVSSIMAEPTFEVHGIVGGYTGPGIKTVIPPSATAKLSTRLVPGQDPDAVFAAITQFITARHPDAEITLESGLAAYLGEFDGPYANAARTATEFAFGVPPVFVREGGSIGAVTIMAEQLKVPIMLMGLSLPEHGYHAPNEHYDWGQASGGIKQFACYFAEIASL